MIHEASEWVWGVSVCLGGAHAWIQLGTRSEVTQTWQERCLLWDQDANYYAQRDVGYCRAHTLSQRQCQENFCLQECHVSYPPWQLPWVIPSPWRRCIPQAGHTEHSCCPARVRYPFWFPGPGERAAATAPMPTRSCVLLEGAGRGQVVPSLPRGVLNSLYATWKFHLFL